MKVKRGLGIECNGIKANPPSMMIFTRTDSDYESQSQEFKSDLSEVILKIYANAEARRDYYNARIASWEPLLESSHLNCELEQQNGNRSRPGALSLALSDHRALEGSADLEQFLVCINITDAAADPLMESLFHFLPFPVSEDNYWMKYSLVRDGAIFFKQLQNVRRSKSTLIAIETVDGEVFRSFT